MVAPARRMRGDAGTIFVVGLAQRVRIRRLRLETGAEQGVTSDAARTVVEPVQPVALDLPGPSRRIRVEPLAPPVPAPAPARDPAPAPPAEPVRVEPREPVPA